MSDDLAFNYLNDLLVKSWKIATFSSDEPFLTSVSLVAFRVLDRSLGSEHKSTTLLDDTTSDGSKNLDLDSLSVGLRSSYLPLLASLSLDLSI